MAVLNKSEYAITARIKSRFGKLPDRDYYLSLSSCRTVNEAVSLLKERPEYKKILGEAGTLNRGILEHSLLFCHYDDLSKLFGAAYYLSSDIYKMLLAEYNRNFAMRYARLYNAGKLGMFTYKTPDFIRQRMAGKAPAFSIDTKPYEFISRMKNSKYKDMLMPFFGADVEQVDLNGLENALLKYTFEVYADLKTEAMTKKDAEEYEMLYCRFAELRNIETIVRGKQNFNMDETQLKKHLLPYSGVISSKKLDELCSMPLDEVQRYLKNNKRFNFNTDESISLQVERKIYKLCRKTVSFSMGSASTLFAYMLLSRQKVQCITVIIEGIRYGLPQEKIMSLLPI